MSESKARHRVALLGARQGELELMAELHRLDRVDLVAVYDPDPHAVGLALAEIIGIPAGSDNAARESLRKADIVILPENRLAMREAIEWSSGLRSELINMDEARRRWGSLAARASPPLAASNAASQLQDLDEAGTRLRTPAELGEWLLETLMRSVGATGGSLQLLAANGNELYLLAARGLSERVVRYARKPLGEPVAGLAVTLRKPQLIHGDREASASRDRGSLSSGMSVPLQLESDNVIGVLNLSTSIPGHRFLETQMQSMLDLAPRIARLLQRTREYETSESRKAEAQFVDLLRELEEQGLDLQSSLSKLCRSLCGAVEAEMVALYLATDEGDWLQLSGADRTGGEHRLPASRGVAGKAYLERRWLQLAETPGRKRPQPDLTAQDLISDAVDAALAADSDLEPMHSCVYAPLIGTKPLGVLTAEFSELALSERFMEQGEPWVEKIALYVETRIRERRMGLRVQRLSKLARTVPRLIEAHRQGTLDEAIVRQAAQLVNAERATFRLVDEARRTYSPPVLYGIPESEATKWRQLDANISEKTLQRRESVLTTTMKSESDRLDESVRYRSLLSVPVVLRGHILGLLNVYNKLPLDMLDSYTFGSFDLELIESMAEAVAAIVEDQPTAPVGSPTDATDDSQSDPTDRPASHAASARESATDPVDPRREPEGALQRFEAAFARAALEEHEWIVTRLRFEGLENLPVDKRAHCLEELQVALREMAGHPDLVTALDSDELVVLMHSSTFNREELLEILEGILRRASSGTHEAPLQIATQVGTSTYPHDGRDLALLLHVAARRQ